MKLLIIKVLYTRVNHLLLMSSENNKEVSKMAKMMAYGSGTILMAKSGMRELGKMVLKLK